MVALAIVALLGSAIAMLAVPIGVRRMIDYGFSSENTEFIDKYFAMMLVIGTVLAISSATRFYAVNWIGERVTNMPAKKLQIFEPGTGPGQGNWRNIPQPPKKK